MEHSTKINRVESKKKKILYIYNLQVQILKYDDALVSKKAARVRLLVCCNRHSQQGRQHWKLEIKLYIKSWVTGRVSTIVKLNTAVNTQYTE